MTGSICDVMPAVADCLGVAGEADRIGLGERVGGVSRLLVLMVDGMGLRLLPRLAPSAPTLARIVAGELGTLDELACTFPSTTPTSLVSFGTGERPGRHGVLGFTVRVPGTDRVLHHVRWRDDPPYREWAPVRTWFERIAAAGVPVTTVLPVEFDGSGLTAAAYGGARFVGLARRDDPAPALLAELAAQPGLVLGYTAALDTAAHLHGIGSPEWQQAAVTVDRLVERLLAGLPADAALVITADHGGLDVPADGRPDIATDPRLAAGVQVVAGEPRARYLHTEPGAVDDVCAAWRQVLGARAEVLTRAEAVARGLFGPVAAPFEERIGDVVVVARGDTVVLSTGTESPESARLVGFHGALEPDETAIPLITLRR